ncbi:MAG: hypothetical protein ABEJ28_10280 [Salinigranum sp.]
MTDSLEDVGEDIRAEVGDDGGSLGDEGGPLEGFVEALRTGSDGSLRLVVRYDGDDRAVTYVREDVAAGYDEGELDERVRTLTLKALGDPVSDKSIEDFGALAATVRWFGDVVVATFPTGEWDGVVAVFDRSSSTLVDAALDSLR